MSKKSNTIISNGNSDVVGGAWTQPAIFAGGERHQAPPIISEIIKKKLIEIAVRGEDASAKKSRIMYLYEKQIIAAGDVERLFDDYKSRNE